MSETNFPVHIGLDIGSTTVKVIILDDCARVLYARYQRHFSDVRATVGQLLAQALAQTQAHVQDGSILSGCSLPIKQNATHPVTPAKKPADASSGAYVEPENGACAYTLTSSGSGAIALAEELNIPFVQEVIASAASIRHCIPDVDVTVELGGEDAKITFFTGGVEQRMNETCAGGTGAFIDQMAAFLNTDAAGLNDLASNHRTLYPIASRCGVFAKTDILPLLNEGCAKEDLAASIFQAVVDQAISGLACGREIKGKVAFLGGPLAFLPALRQRFVDSLALAEDEALFPEHAEYFVAMGAALHSIQQMKTTSMSTQAAKITHSWAELNAIADSLSTTAGVRTTPHLPALFATPQDLDEFHQRHAKNKAPRALLKNIPAPADNADNADAGEALLYLGIDIGSTTIKAVLIDDKGTLLYTSYAASHGEPMAAAVEILRDIYRQIPAHARIAAAGVTGYGSGLVRAGLRADVDEVETLAHCKAAQFFLPTVSFVLDIGGQDIKCLHVKNGIVDRIQLNEACSAGCGSFIETFAKSLGMDLPSFVHEALHAPHPVDLGTRCTVFMNSRVKQAQKEGSPVGDIAAGLSYAVIKNALYKVIKIASPGDLGASVMAQGGAFHNDALLRALELSLGRNVVRLDISGLMGAFGAALLAQEHGPVQSSLLSPQELEEFHVDSTVTRCQHCTNHCQLTVTRFYDGTRFISGNRCERGAGKSTVRNDLPNLYAWKYQRIFEHYVPLPADKAPRGTLGIPRALNMFENYPLWFTLLTELGFRVELSAPSSKKLFGQGSGTIPSQTVCYPAKLAHGHVVDLVNRHIMNIFYPCIPFEHKEFASQDNQFNCPVVGGYPELLRNNIGMLHDSSVTMHCPFLPLEPQRLVQRLKEEALFVGISHAELQRAVELGLEEQENFKADVRKAGDDALLFLQQSGRQGIILAGHPYHIDPEVHHGIPDMITATGLAVLTEDSVAHRVPHPGTLRVVDQWTYHGRLYRAAAFAAQNELVALVQLVSFGCGLDAVTADQVEEILTASDRLYTQIKIDEGANLGAARIRIRSLLATMRERKGKLAATREGFSSGHPVPPRPGTAGFVQSRQQNLDDNACDSINGLDAPAISSDVFFLPLDGTKEIDSDALRAALQSDATHRPHLSAADPSGHGAPAFPSFTTAMRATHTILIPQMSPLHFQFLPPLFTASGYKAELLPTVSREALELGLRHVNNDVCYPAITVIGQLLHAIQSGQYDPNRIAVIVSQTGGGCRATNYIAFLRKALIECGLEQIPILSFNMEGMDRNPGFRIDWPFMRRAIMACFYGDLIMRMLYRIRPYEQDPGATERLAAAWAEKARLNVAAGSLRHFYRQIKDMVWDFDHLALRGIPRKPRVGLVGEILLKFHPDANNSAVEVVEAEGGEAVMPDMMEFFLYGFYDDVFRYRFLAGARKKAVISNLALHAILALRLPIRHALARSQRFEPPLPFRSLRKQVEGVVSLGHQTGEGWLLTAEMMELLRGGVPNILCMQPFGCLPNHITGKGVLKELKRRFPHANIAAVDYDPGASEVNQINRIKLMMAVARHPDARNPRNS